MAPTANLNPERRFPSMFEPIHGSAFDIMGKGIANPIASFWTRGDDARASGRERRRVPPHGGDRARQRPIRARHTPDLGGNATTAQVTQAVRDAIVSANA